jgi:hypothetical protein
LSPASRRRTGTYRPPRDRREIAVAVLAAIAVVAVTAALLFVLRPRDDSTDVPPVQAPLPTESTAPTTAPASTVAPETTAAPAP